MSLLDELTAEELAARFRQSTPEALPEGWENHSKVFEAHQILADESLGKLPPIPEFERSRGIVVCAGGHGLFTNAWVCLRMLRHFDCRLPVQFWYLGEQEMDGTMRRLVANHGAECVDAREVAQEHPVRTLNGFELKPFAIIQSPFREVMLLDADNVPIRDPTYLFLTVEFQQHGAIFWPDFHRLEPFRGIWEACQVEYRDEPEFESGQIVVDKARCWEALNVTMHYNEHSDFYYRHIHGDKDTFHLAFLRTGKSFAMPSRGIDALDATMCQHDFDGNRVFQHRNMDKWMLDGTNRKIDDFLHEDLCREYLAELREQWSGTVHWNATPTPIEHAVINELADKTYRYTRVGYDARLVELRRDRTIAEGANRCERLWTVTLDEGRLSLVLLGDEGATCLLVPNGTTWQGRWLHHERMPVVLEAIEAHRSR
jgi:hypothetical protein